jgi:hypothetical protein
LAEDLARLANLNYSIVAAVETFAGAAGRQMFDMKKFLGILATIPLALLGITKSDIFSPEVAQFLSQTVTARLSLLIGVVVVFVAIMLFSVAYTSLELGPPTRRFC